MVNNTESGFIINGNGQQDTSISVGYNNRVCLSRSVNSVITKAQRSGRMWILKSVPHDADNYLMRQELLKKEYDILCQLNHPYIVHAIELIEDAELGTAVVMEYIDGKALSEMDSLSRADKLHIVKMLLEAMSYVHGKQIVHRDLKPDNILLTHNGQNIKIIDFGFADTDSHTTLKQPAGTLQYISPEQKEEAVADVRNDIYSLGMIFGEMDLPWQYKHILKRMTSPVNKRYNSIHDVQRAFSRASYLPRIIAAIAAITLLIIIAHFGVQNIRTQQLRIKEQEQRILSQEKTIQEQVKNINDQSEELARQTEKIDELNVIKEEQDKFNSVFAQGKKVIDDYMKSVNFKRIIAKSGDKTLEDLRQATQAQGQTYKLIFSFVEKQQLEPQKASELRTYLEQYFMQEYWQPWCNNQ